MTEDKIKEIYRERNKQLPISFIVTFDNKWGEMQQIFRGMNVDLSKIQIALENKK